MKRIYIVKAVQEVDMPILASSEEEAREIANKNIDEAFQWDGGLKRRVTDGVRTVHECDMDSIPWGQDGGELTVVQLLTRGIADSEGL